jgi:hypothetical protein
MKCGWKSDLAFASFADMMRALLKCPRCAGSVTRLPSCAQFEMKGFREENGYASASKRETVTNGIRTKVEGNLEILRDFK